MKLFFAATLAATCIAQSGIAAEPDIVGVRLGMTWTEAKAVLAKRGQALIIPLYTISVVGDSKAAEKYGYSYQVNFQMAKGNESINISLYPKSANGKLSDPSNLIVHHVRRSIGYEQGKAPAVAATFGSLNDKYGTANEAVNEGFNTIISWLPGEPGNLTPADLQALTWNKPVSDRIYKCYSAPNIYPTINDQLSSSSTKPAAGFDMRSWSGWQSCGLVVRAIINTDRNGIVQTVIQDLLDFKDYDTIVAAKNAAEQKIKAEIAADSNAAAPKQVF